MNLLSLVLVNLGRNKRRTLLTMLSVGAALFLFCALRGVLDTLKGSIALESETRLVTRDARSLVFFLPISLREKIAAVPGVKSVTVVDWFGAQDPTDTHGFFAQFAVDAATYFPIRARDLEIVDASPPQAPVSLPAGVDPKLAAFMLERNACVVGEGLMKKKHWKLGQTVTLSGTIFPGSWPFVIRAVYHPKLSSYSPDFMLFHLEYLAEKGMGGTTMAGMYFFELSDPTRAPDIAKQVDALFENSATPTHTESERAFQAGFISMYGNIPFALQVIGLAVVFSILLVAANTMMMAFRERIPEVGVMKTLGFADGTVFAVVLAEGLVMTLVAGLAGALLAKLLLSGYDVHLLPPLRVDWGTVGWGIGAAVLLGAVSGLLPAWQASRLRIVDALRRVE